MLFLLACAPARLPPATSAPAHWQNVSLKTVRWTKSGAAPRSSAALIKHTPESVEAKAPRSYQNSLPRQTHLSAVNPMKSLGSPANANEALAQQTATSEVLEVISGSPDDVQQYLRPCCRKRFASAMPRLETSSAGR